MKNFDPNHSRCIFPRYGAIVDAAMQARKLSSETVAETMGVDGSAVRGYRRGFGRNTPARTAALESILGVKLDMSELTPSAKAAAAKSVPAKIKPSTDPVLPHLAAIARAYGFVVSFTPVAP